MGKRQVEPSTRYGELAEGAARVGEPSVPRERRESGPAGRLSSRLGPAGETGLIPAIHIAAESAGRDDLQDASRTTAEITPMPAVERPAPGERSSPLVMIVEDIPAMAEFLRITLERMNVRCVVATHGQEALAHFHELRPDVLLLDLVLPDLPGWKLLDAIRESVGPSGKMPAVVVITAYGDSTNRLVGKMQNVHAYLVKPFTSEEVARVLRQVLNGPVA